MSDFFAVINIFCLEFLTKREVKSIIFLIIFKNKFNSGPL